MLALVAGAGCATTPPKSDYALSLRVESDPGRPLAGAAVLLGERVLGTSDEGGRVALTAQGREGDVLSFRIECPSGHQAPAAPLAVVLRRLSERDRRPEFVARCRPTERTVVVAVRAERGPNLPVLYLGREVARTDRAGAAHVSLRSTPEDTLELMLDTKDSPRLRPRSPSARFRVGETDDLVVLNQKFQVDAVKAGPRQARGPVRIGQRSL